MTPDLVLRYVFLCVLSGAGLGLFYVLLKMLRILFGIKKIGTAVLDILFFSVAGVVLFLVALAADRGRLRFVQVSLQLIGFLSVLLAVDPSVEQVSAYIYRKSVKVSTKIKRKFRVRLHKWVFNLQKWRKRLKKVSRFHKKTKKRLEKIM